MAGGKECRQNMEADWDCAWARMKAADAACREAYARAARYPDIGRPGGAAAWRAYSEALRAFLDATAALATARATFPGPAAPGGFRGQQE